MHAGQSAAARPAAAQLGQHVVVRAANHCPQVLEEENALLTAQLRRLETDVTAKDAVAAKLVRRCAGGSSHTPCSSRRSPRLRRSSRHGAMQAREH